MATVLGILLFLVFLFLSGIHFYWGAGGVWGKDSSVPSKESGEIVLKPKAIDCFIVALALLAFALFVLVKVDLLVLNLPEWVRHNLLWMIASLFVLRALGDFKYVGFFKKIKNTRFAVLDTKYFSPLCLLIALLCFVIQMFSRSF